MPEQQPRLNPEDETVFSHVELEGDQKVRKELELGTPALVEATLDWLKQAEGLRAFIPETSFEAQPDGSYVIIQDRVEGETLRLDEEGKVAQSLTDLNRKELSTIMHESVSVYLQTGSSMEFEKPDSYVLGRNLAQPQHGEGLYLVDVYPAFPRDKTEVIRQIEKAGERFGLDEQEVVAEKQRLEEVEHAQAA